MDKKKLSEQDICLRYITPSIEKAGWNRDKQIRMEYTLTDGRIIVKGSLASRGKKKRADYVLSHINNLPIAVVEAKDNKHNIGDGMQQALGYAKMLDVPFAYSSNGDGFVEYDFSTGKETNLSLEEFPSPEELWTRYKRIKEIVNDNEEKIITEPYHYDAENRISPRYYQSVAINRTLEAISKGQDRILLVMATGTGKTYTAFQIMWRLREAKRVKKILYLVDRNVLVDQSVIEDFAPLKKVITQVKSRKLNSAYEIHLSLYHQLVGNDGEEIFRDFKPDYFDLIIIDEAHRGSAREDSAWRKILEYFSSAIQIGMTATPKETKQVSNIEYFGEPVYTYSLKQGIRDGFLAPYKVIRVGIDKDLEGYRPERGKRDIEGELVEDREYNIKDFDRNIVIDERTKLVAKKVSEYMKKTDRRAKTIVFCVDIEHANRMRQALINENSDLMRENPKYIMKITGDDKEGKAQLDNFISVNSKYPTIAITSKLMTTGVNTKMCKNIVIDRHIESLIEFKQIIGRGTRVREDDGKMFFTIIDFRDATRNFADPEFDDDPVKIKEVKQDEEMPDNNDYENEDSEEVGEEGINGSDSSIYRDDNDEEYKTHKKIYVKGVNVKVLNERVQYLGKDGKLITESVKDYSRKNILEHFDTMDDFIKKWNDEDKKQAIIYELESEGVLFEELRELIGKEFDAFDLIMHIAFDKKPLTRAERANNVKKKGYLYQYSVVAQKVLEELLSKYRDEDIVDLDDTKILELKPFDEIGSSLKIVKAFGGKSKFTKAIRELEKNLYA